MSAVKVLLAGDCLGGFEALFKKVAAVNKKNGPFDLLFCVGQFFGESSDDGDVPQALQAYVDGSAQLPVTTYFLGGYGKGSAATLDALEAPLQEGRCRNLHYLGRVGVTQLEALNVAFLDGTFSGAAFHSKPPPPKLPPPPASPQKADGTATQNGGGGHAAAAAEAEPADAGAADAAMPDAAAAPAADADAAAGAETAAPMEQEESTAAAADGDGSLPPAGTGNGDAGGSTVAAAAAAAAASGTHAAAARAKQKQAEAAAHAARQAELDAAASRVCRHYTQSDVARLKHQLMVLPGEVDLLLTCEWPAGVLKQLPPGQEAQPGYQAKFCSSVGADIAGLARPRYHVAGGQSIFMTRLPYTNPDLGAGPRASRFVSLGSVVARRNTNALTAAAAAAADTAANTAAAAMAGGSGPVIGPAGETAAAAGTAAGGGGGGGRGVIGAINTQQAAAMAAAAAATAAAATSAADAAAAAVKAQKYLHALALVPASCLSIEQLGALPDGVGGFPYKKEDRGAAVGEKRGSTATYEHDSVGEHCAWRWLPPKRMRGGFGGGPVHQGPPFQPWGKPGVTKDSARSVFVRNLPYEATYEDLAAFFSQAGQVEDIRRQAQTDSGRPQPWCHVQFTDYSAVPAACSLNGQRFQGRDLTVATSTPLTGGPPAGQQQPGDWRYESDEAAAAAEKAAGGAGYGSSHGQQQQQQQQRGQGGQQRGRGRGARGGQLRYPGPPLPEPGKPVEGCWFCLSSDQVDVELVSSVGDEVYLALDKGPITPQHALIIPIEHYPSWMALPPAAGAEINRYLSALRSAAASGGQQLVGFERHLKLRSKGGNHTHINTLPISKESGEGAAAVFQEMAAQHGLTLVPVTEVDGQLDLAVLQQVVGEGEYFLGLLPDGSGLAAPFVPGQRAPLQLGRQILAQLAGVPERADWKECTYNGDEEKAAAEAFRDYFKPYDIMQAEE